MGNLIGILSKGAGVPAVIESKTITANGTYAAPEGVDGYNPVNVQVPERQPVTARLEVTENGTYTPGSSVDGYKPVVVNVPQQAARIEPKTITENGTYAAPEGLDGYSPIIVNVEQLPSIEPKTITENGTYTAPEGVDGYSPIIVNVPSGVQAMTNAWWSRAQSSMAIIFNYDDIDITWNGGASNFMAQLNALLNLNNYSKAYAEFDTGALLHDQSQTAEHLKIWFGSATAKYNYLINTPQAPSLYNSGAYVSFDKSNSHAKLEIPLGHTNDYLMFSAFGANVSNLKIWVE